MKSPQFFDLFINVISEEELIGEVFDDSIDAVLGQSPQVGKHPQCLPARHLFDRGVKLRAITQSPLHGFDIPSDAESVEVGVTVRNFNVARQHFESRRFAGAVDAQQTEAFATTHPQAEAVHRTEASIVIFH